MIKAFVIGDPIAHSKSPLIHGQWLNRYAIAGSYEAIRVTPSELSNFLDQVRKGAFAGGNVTIPHKQAAFAACDHVEGEAARIGAVNTIVVRDGKLVGTNTDVYGFLANLDANAPGWDANIGQVMVLGAGGASRAVIAGLLSRGAKVALVNRSVEKAQELAAIFGKAVTAHRFDEVSDLAPMSDMLVNTTAIGMGGSAFTDFPLSAFGPKTLVTDIVYTPLITPLLADARRQGLPIVDGLGMLLYQAVPGFTAWFGTRPDVSQTLRDTVIKAMGD